MNGYDDDKLEIYLRARRVPSPPDGLSTRIINSVLAEEQRAARHKQRYGVWARLRTVGAVIAADISENFMLPRPAYAFAMMLIIGLTLGMNSERLGLVSPANAAGTDISTFMMVDESFTPNDLMEAGR